MSPVEKKKFSRKDLKRPDEFLARSAEAGEWVQIHRREIMIVSGSVLGALLIAAVVYVVMQERATRNAKTMSVALEVLGRPVQNIQLFSGSDDGTKDEESFSSGFEKDEAVAKAFADAGKRISGGPLGAIATLEEAQALLGMNRYGEAILAYQKFVADPDGAESFLFLGYEGMGMAYEGQGKLDEAMKQYRALEGVGDGKYTALALYHQGRVLELQTKKDEAKEAYGRLAKMIKEAPKMTPMLGYLQERIAGKEGVPKDLGMGMGGMGGEPGLLMGPDGQMYPSPGAGGQDFDPEQLKQLQEALKKLAAEKQGQPKEGEKP